MWTLEELIGRMKGQSQWVRYGLMAIAVGLTVYAASRGGEGRAVIDLATRGWEIFAMGIIAFIVSGVQVMTGKTMRFRKDDIIPEWVRREDEPDLFPWSVVSLAAFGLISVCYGIGQVLQYSN